MKDGLYWVRFWKNSEGWLSPRETCRQEWFITFAPGGHFSNGKSVEKLSISAFQLIFSFEKRPHGAKVMNPSCRQVSGGVNPRILSTHLEGGNRGTELRKNNGQEWFITFAPWGRFPNEKVRWTALTLSFPTHFFFWKTTSWSKNYDYPSCRQVFRVVSELNWINSIQFSN